MRPRAAKWEPGASTPSEVHVVAVSGVRAFPPGQSNVDRAAIQRAFQRAGMKVKGPVLTVGLQVTDDDGRPAMLVLALAPTSAPGLIAAIEAAGVVDRAAVHAARAQLTRSLSLMEGEEGQR